MFRDRRSRFPHRHGHFKEGAFQKGDLKYVILDLLKDHPRHGYDIIRALEERSMGTYKPSPGAVYPTLQMLEEMGYTASEERDGKKTYTLTEAGQQFLAERKDSADEVRSHMKRRWSFKNIGRMAQVMKEYHSLEDVISHGIKDLDAERARRIREVLISARSDIESIYAED